MCETNHDAPVSAAKSLTNIIFLVDTSGSMIGQKIEAVNTALQDSIPFIREFGQEDASVKVQCSLLIFNDRVKWLDKAIDTEDLVWTPAKAEGGTRLGGAYTELCNALSRKDLLAQHRNNQPIIFLLTDGYPTDQADEPLKKLYQNGWFKNAMKVAIALPGDVDFSKLLGFVGGNKELIIPVTLDGLKGKLQNIIMTTLSASMTLDENERMDEMRKSGGGENIPDNIQPCILVPSDEEENNDGNGDNSIDWDNLED